MSPANVVTSMFDCGELCGLAYPTPFPVSSAKNQPRWWRETGKISIAQAASFF